MPNEEELNQYAELREANINAEYWWRDAAPATVRAAEEPRGFPVFPAAMSSDGPAAVSAQCWQLCRVLMQAAQIASWTEPRAALPWPECSDAHAVRVRDAWSEVAALQSEAPDVLSALVADAREKVERFYQLWCGRFYVTESLTESREE